MKSLDEQMFDPPTKVALGTVVLVDPDGTVLAGPVPLRWSGNSLVNAEPLSFTAPERMLAPRVTFVTNGGETYPDGESRSFYLDAGQTICAPAGDCRLHLDRTVSGDRPWRERTMALKVPDAPCQGCEYRDCDTHVGCDEACGALLVPVTLTDFEAAAIHWRSHEWCGGCSHGG